MLKKKLNTINIIKVISIFRQHEDLCL